MRMQTMAAAVWIAYGSFRAVPHAAWRLMKAKNGDIIPVLPDKWGRWYG